MKKTNGHGYSPDLHDALVQDLLPRAEALYTGWITSGESM